MFHRFFFMIIMSVLTTLCFAKNINLYDTPKADAKIVGTISTDAGIIPIFTPKEGSWIKVADPRNGNVGWIKNSDLNVSGGSTGFTFTQHIISTGKEPGSYQIIQFGNPQQHMSSEQTQKMLQQMQERQQAIQHDTQKMIQDMYKNMNQESINLPMIMPVIVLPVQPSTVPQTPAKQK